MAGREYFVNFENPQPNLNIWTPFNKMEDSSGILYHSALIVLAISFLLKLILNKKWSIYILLLGGFIMALSAISRDEYLHPWDERYHALVAKNMIDAPLSPTLYKDTLLQDSHHTEWYNAHIWLHKQPLFLWQMALCMKVFGVNLVSMRLSSAIMLFIFGFAVFRATNLYFPKSSFWVTFLALVQPYLLLLVSGRNGMDHNDITFITWTAVAFWGLMAYLKKPHWKWIVFIGFGVGCAMLTKWLAGAFVLCIWGLHLIVSSHYTRSEWLGLMKAILLSLLIFIPWQIYAYSHFTEVFLKEWEYNSRHLTEILEQHGQPWYFHLKVWWENFTLLSILFLAALPFVFFRKKPFPLILSLLISLFAALLFYSLAQTKLSSYTLFILPLVLYMAAYVLEKVNPQWLRVIISIALIFFAWHEFKIGYVYNVQNEHNINHQRAIKHIAEEIVDEYPKNTVIFNVPPMEFVEFMFYTGETAYQFIPQKEQVLSLKNRGYQSLLLLAPNEPLDTSLQNLVEVKRVEIPAAE